MSTNDLLTTLLSGCLCTISFFGIGNALLSCAHAQTKQFKQALTNLELFLLSSAVGIGTVVLGLFIFGLMKLMFPSVAWGIAVVGLLLAMVAIKRTRRIRSIRQEVRMYWKTVSRSLSLTLCLAMLTFGILITIIVNIAPTTVGDSLDYYIRFPKFWIASHAFFYPDFHIAPTLPGNIMMLNAFGMLLLNQSLAQLLSGTYVSILSVLAVYSLARQNLDIHSSTFAAATFYFIPAICNWLALSSKFQIGWFLFVILAIHYVFKSFSRSTDSSIYSLLSGALFGIALGSSLISIPFYFAFLFFYAAAVFFQRSSLSQVFTSTLLFTSSALIFGCNYYIYNWLLHGSPLYPFLGGTELNQFGGKGILDYSSAMVNRVGITVDLSLTQLLKYLYRMSTHLSPHGGGKGWGPLLIPISTVSTLCFPKMRRWPFIIYYLSMFGAMALSFLLMPMTRHILPALGLGCVLCGYAISQHRSHGIRKIIGLFCLFFFFFFQWNYTKLVSSYLNGLEVQYFIGHINNTEYLEKKLEHSSWDINAVNYLNNHTNTEDNVIAASAALPMSYLNNKLYNATTFKAYKGVTLLELITLKNVKYIVIPKYDRSDLQMLELFKNTYGLTYGELKQMCNPVFETDKNYILQSAHLVNSSKFNNLDQKALKLCLP